MSDDDEEEEDCFADVGFMFEGAEPSVVERFEWKTPEHTTIRVAVKVVNDDPGAVQSGHYLWPGAPALAQHLLTLVADSPPPQALVELGAGCALASLTALQLFPTSLRCVVCTDHDPGTLTRAKENYDLNIQQLHENVSVEEDRNTTLSRISSIPFLTEPLSWGNVDAASSLLAKLQTTLKTTQAANSSSSLIKFDWVLGSDLIYCREIVEPLFVSASHLLGRQRPTSKFILSQSFVYDEGTENEIDNICETLGLERTICLDTLSEPGKDGVKIQEFQWKRDL